MNNRTSLTIQTSQLNTAQAASPVPQKHAPELEGHQTEDLEEKHSRSQFILKECGSKWPSLSVIQKASDDWTIPSLKARIHELKAEHRSQLIKCVQYLKMKEDASLDDFDTLCEDMQPWCYYGQDVITAITKFYGMESRIMTRKSNDFIIQLRHIQFETLTPFYRKLRELQIIEDRARQRRAKLFPKSTQSWRDMDTKDAKLAVARFLMLDKKQQEDHLNRNKIWKDSKTDVHNLCLEYENNVVFAQEIKTFLKENETTDPRRKGQ